MLSIRLARAEDADAIAQVHVSSWHTTYRGIVPDAYLSALNVEECSQRWRNQVTDGMRVLVAEQDRNVVGFSCGGPIREPVAGYDAELYAIYLLQKSQRSGIGTRLLKEIASILAAAGYRSMIVYALEANESVQFYERTGAVPVTRTTMEIGGAQLPLVSFGWPVLRTVFQN